MPPPASPDSNSLIAPMAIGSRPENGSSSTSRSGSFTSAAISCTRCWLPCDSASSRSAARSARPSRSSQAYTPQLTSSAARPHSSPRYTSWSCTRIRGYRPRSSGMYPNRARSAAETGRPSHRTVPASSSTSPNTARIAVVFPAPLGPRKPVSRPGRAANVHPSRAVTAPNRFAAPSKSSIPITPIRGWSQSKRRHPRAAANTVQRP